MIDVDVCRTRDFGIANQNAHFEPGIDIKRAGHIRFRRGTIGRRRISLRKRGLPGHAHHEHSNHKGAADVIAQCECGRHFSFLRVDRRLRARDNRLQCGTRRVLRGSGLRRHCSLSSVVIVSNDNDCCIICSDPPAAR